MPREEDVTAAEKTRAGIMGAGMMAGVHAHAIRAAGGRVRSVIGSNPESTARAVATLGAEHASATDADLVSEVDVVHVCTPNTLHLDQALSALAAGRHVICEKPLATTTADARLLVDAWRASGSVGAVPFVYRYHPMVREARAMVREGEAGMVISLQAAYLQDWMLRESDGNWRAGGALGGASRAFADIGSHLCDVIEFISGERIVRLSARTRTVFTERAGQPVHNEDIAAVLVELSGGAVGTLLVSQMAAGRKNGLVVEIHGTRQTLRFDQERPEELWLGGRERSLLRLRDPAELRADARRLSTVPAGHPIGYQDAFNGFVRDAYAAIRGESPEGLPTFWDGLRATLVTDAVLQSSSTDGSWVDVIPLED